MSETLNSAPNHCNENNFTVGDKNLYITSASSKGNQSKWLLDNNFLKADDLGYEGLAEYAAYEMSKFTNIEEKLGFLVEYKLCIINDGLKNHNGCVSKYFTQPDEQIISIRRLYSQYGKSVDNEVDKLQSVEERVTSVVEFVEAQTGLTGFGEYLTLLMEFDALIFNEDRHFHNIALIKKPLGYAFTPVFDNGAAFLSDCTLDYPLNKPFEVCLRNVKAKPFSRSFAKQVEACRNLYGSQLIIKGDIGSVKNKISGLSLYPDNMKERAVSALLRGAELYKTYK